MYVKTPPHILRSNLDSIININLADLATEFALILSRDFVPPGILNHIYLCYESRFKKNHNTIWQLTLNGQAVSPVSHPRQLSDSETMYHLFY